MDRLACRRLTEPMTTSPYVLTVSTAALSSAAVGGLFYAFSTFVMRGLDRTGPLPAITAMRGINTEAQANAPFLIVFVGSTLLAVAVGIMAATRLTHSGSTWLLAGAVLSVLAFVVTMACNVPLNDHLASLDPATLSPGDALREWQAYLVPWTNWNHVRTVSPLLGSALMLMGLRQH
jgi:uncharacterized membrane protein